MTYKDPGDLEPTVTSSYKDPGDLETTVKSDSPDQQDLPEASLLNKVARVGAHSVYEGVVRPIAGLGNLVTGETNALSHLIDKGDEWDKSLDDGYKKDWADKGGWASTLGSWAAFLIPGTLEAKGLEGIGTGLKALTDPETYKAEKGITEGWKAIQDALKKDKGENGLSNAEELATKRSDLQATRQDKIDTEPNETNTSLDGNIKQKEEEIDALEQKQNAISKAQGEFNSSVEKNLKNMKNTPLTPKLSSNIIDHLLTGKKGYGIGQGAVIGGMTGAADTSNEDLYHQELAAGFGAATGGALTGALNFLIHSSPNLFSDFKTKSSASNVPLTTNQQRKYVQDLNNLKAIESQSETANAFNNEGQRVDTSAKALAQTGEISKKLPETQPTIQTNENENIKKTEDVDQIKNIIKYAHKSQIGFDPRTKTNTEDEDIRNYNLAKVKPVSQLDAADINLGLSKGLFGDRDSDDPIAIKNPVNEIRKFLIPIAHYLKVPHLNAARGMKAFLDHHLQKAYSLAKQDQHQVPLQLEKLTNHIKDFVNENHASLEETNQTYSPFYNVVYRNTKAYKGLENAKTYLDKLADQNKEGINAVTESDINKGLEELDPYTQSRLKEELENTQGNIQEAYNNLTKRYNDFKINNNMRISPENNKLARNKHLAMQNELNTNTSKTLKGNEIPSDQIQNIRNQMAAILDSNKEEHNINKFYSAIGERLNNELNNHQDDIFLNYLKKELENGSDTNLSQLYKRKIKISPILYQLNQDIESGDLGHNFISKYLGLNDSMNFENLTDAQIANSINKPDNETNTFINNLKKLQSNNKNIQNLLKQYKTNTWESPEDHLANEISKVKAFSEKSNATNNQNTNPQRQQANAAYIAMTPLLRQLEKIHNQTRTAQENMINYLGYQSLFNNMNNLTSTLKAAPTLAKHLGKHLYFGIAKGGGHEGFFMDENLRNLFYPNEDKFNVDNIRSAKTHITGISPKVDLNFLTDIKHPKVRELIKNLDKNSEIPIYNAEHGTVTYKPLKDATANEIHDAVAYNRQKMEELQNAVKHTSNFVSKTGSSVGENLKEANNTLKYLMAHLPHKKVQVNAAVSTVPQSVLNFLMQPNPNNKNQ